MAPELKASVFDLDSLAPNGVFFDYDPNDQCPYNIRKYAAIVKKLGLKPGEKMPDEYLKECLL